MSRLKERRAWADLRFERAAGRHLEHARQADWLKKYATQHGPRKGPKLVHRIKIVATPGCGQNRSESPCPSCRDADCPHRVRTVSFRSLG